MKGKMMEKIRELDLGEFKISVEALEMIIGTAALEIEGVAFLACGMAESIADWLGKKKARGIHVTIENSNIIADVHLTVKYGWVVRETAQKVQAQVKEALESMIGKEVKEVNVFVDSIYFREQ